MNNHSSRAENRSPHLFDSWAPRWQCYSLSAAQSGRDRRYGYHSHLPQSFIPLFKNTMYPAFRSESGEIKSLDAINVGLWSGKLTGSFRRSKVEGGMSMAPMSLRRRYMGREVNGRMPDIAK